MVIFHSYVSLPEGRTYPNRDWPIGLVFSQCPGEVSTQIHGIQVKVFKGDIGDLAADGWRDIRGILGENRRVHHQMGNLFLKDIKHLGMNILFIYIYVYIYIWGMKLKYGTSDARTMEQCDSVQLRWVAVATKHQEVRPLIQPWIDRRHLLRCTWYANVATATAFVTFPVQISELTLSGALDLASFDKSMEHLLTTGTQLKCVEESSMNTPTNTCLIFWSWINAQIYLNNNHPFWEPHNFEPYSSCRSAIILPFPHPRYYISSWCWLYPHCITILVGWGYLSPHF